MRLVLSALAGTALGVVGVFWWPAWVVGLVVLAGAVAWTNSEVRLIERAEGVSIAIHTGRNWQAMTRRELQQLGHRWYVEHRGQSYHDFHRASPHSGSGEDR